MDAAAEGADDIDGELSDVSDEEGNDELEEPEFGGSDNLAFGPLHVLPLFSNLAQDQQQKIFEDVPAGHRLCVVRPLRLRTRATRVCACVCVCVHVCVCVCVCVCALSPSTPQ